MLTKTGLEQLRQCIVPDLVAGVGDTKSQRLSADMVLSFLQQRALVFDSQKVCMPGVLGALTCT